MKDSKVMNKKRSKEKTIIKQKASIITKTNFKIKMFELKIEKDSIAESEQHCYYHQLHLKQHQKIAFRNSIQD